MLLSSQGAALPAGRHMRHATGFAGTELGKPQARIGGKARDGRDETGRHRHCREAPRQYFRYAHTGEVALFCFRQAAQGELDALNAYMKSRRTTMVGRPGLITPRPVPQKEPGISTRRARPLAASPEWGQTGPGAGRSGRRRMVFPLIRRGCLKMHTATLEIRRASTNFTAFGDMLPIS